jgi:hypothetical protein
MCRLEDLRAINFIQTNQALIGYDCEVDENGQATNLTGVQTLGLFRHGQDEVRDRASQLAGYWCSACGQEFSSWDEAKLHIENVDAEL